MRGKSLGIEGSQRILGGDCAYLGSPQRRTPSLGRAPTPNPALLLNHRGDRLGARGARDVLAAIADEAGVNDESSSHVLRHSFGTTVAELMGHAPVETTRAHSLPTDLEDHRRAINSANRLAAVLAAKAPTAKALATPSAKAASAKPVQPPLTGCMAINSAWKGHHHGDPNLAAGSTYDPTPGLAPLGDPTRDDRYCGVSPLGGHVSDYYERFTAGTSLASAKAQSMMEFPNDARVLWFVTKDICSQMEVTSARIGAALGAGSNAAPVEFSNESGTYSAANVTSASFGAVGDVSTPQAAGGC